MAQRMKSLESMNVGSSKELAEEAEMHRLVDKKPVLEFLEYNICMGEKGAIKKNRERDA